MRRGRYKKNRFYRFNAEGYTYINPKDLVSNGQQAPIEEAKEPASGSGVPWDNSVFWDNNEGWS